MPAVSTGDQLADDSLRLGSNLKPQCHMAIWHCWQCHTEYSGTGGAFDVLRNQAIRGYVSKSSAAVNRPTHDHAASL